MFFLEAHDALALLEHDIVPLANTAVGFYLADREVVLVAEANLVDPVLAGLDPHFADGAILVEHHLLVALVDS